MRFTAFWGLLMMCGGAICAAAEQRPNIVVILADDYGYGSAGCYGADGKLIQTPGLDRLAREGRRFTDANTTSSVCSPTRYSVLTGRYCWRTTLTHEVLGTFSPLHIETTRLNMASLLKTKGYTTAAIGKWHLGYGTPDASPKWRTDYTAELKPGPLEIGFDYHYGVPSNHGDVTGVYVENRFVYGLRSGKIPAGMKLPGPDLDDAGFKSQYTEEDSESRKAKAIEIDAPRRVNDRVMPLLTDKAVRWLEQQKPGKPFFLYFTPVAVHNPVTPSKELAGQSAAGPYGDWIAELDRSVGRVLEALDRLNLARDTLVIFTSDNGGVCEPQRESPQTQALRAGLAINGHLRGGKHHVWEGGFKVPFIVRWPGKAPAGTTCNEMISLADLLATTAGVVGETLPGASRAAEDSYNVLPAILDQPHDKPLRPDMIIHSADGVFAIRQGPWKWVEGLPVDDIRPGARKQRAEEFSPHLFNLSDDPSETRDVIKDHPQVAKELESLLERYRAGGYSRETPPQPARPRAVEMPAAADKVVLREVLDTLPPAPWVVVRGKWEARDGAIWGTSKLADQGPAALRGPLSLADGDISYQVRLGSTASHALRLTHQERGHVFHIEISPRKLAVVQQLESGGQQVLARQPVKLPTDTALPARFCFRGKEMLIQVGDQQLRATHEYFAEPRIAFAFLIFGGDVGISNLTIAK